MGPLIKAENKSWKETREEYSKLPNGPSLLLSCHVWGGRAANTICPHRVDRQQIASIILGFKDNAVLRSHGKILNRRETRDLRPKNLPCGPQMS